MATKKNDESEKRIVKIKASIGAWWKSKAAEDELEAVAEPPKKKKTPPRRKPAAGRKKAAARPQPRKTAQSEVETTGTEVDEDKQTKAAQEPKPKSPRRGRRGPRPKKAEQTPASPAIEGSPESQKQVSVEGQGDQAQEGAGLPKESQKESAPQTPASGGGKSRKPRRPARKPKAKSEEKKESGADTEKADAKAEPKVEVEKSPKVGKTAQKPKKKPEREPKEQSATQDVEVEEKPVYKLLINAEEPEECRLALLADGRLEEIHVSTVGRTLTKNNIYKARIVALEPSLQAAFVEYGREKNGFLPFSEIHPEYFKQNLSAETRQLVEQHQWKKLSITDALEKGQEVLAQVVKEEVGKKGANMTTYLSIPGRCAVLMPGSDSAGISRKISGEQRRSQLRDTMKSIEMPEGIGWIVRTASVDITQEALTRDVNYLLKLWADIKRKGQELSGVGIVYEDQDSVLRFLREHFDPDIEEILVDDKQTMEQVRDFVELLPEEQRKVRVRLHQGARPIFNQYSVEDQIESIYQPQVNLPSGGSIVIDPTEALVAIDVNSGSTSKGKNFEASIFQANIEAARELARQLRLRDLGGLIVVDFIDMRNRKNIQAVEKQVRASMKKDKAKTDFSRISKFGLMQISRQKLGSPIEASNYQQCEHCRGRGSVRSVETLSLYYLRRIQTGASRKPVERIECHLPLEVAGYLLNNKRMEIHDMEKKYQVEVIIIAEPSLKPMDNDIIFHKAEKEKNAKKES